MVNIHEIPEVDFILGENYIDNIAGVEKFDYIIASHVIEHVPDLIGWLDSCFRSLKPGGVLSLAVPNANYTFDIARRRTRISDVLAAYAEKRRKPTLQQIADHFGGVVHATAKDIWTGTISSQNAKRLYKDEFVLNLCKKIATSKEYKNCHCWVFGEKEFLETLDRIKTLNLLKFEILDITSTLKNEGEFFCSLRKPL